MTILAAIAPTPRRAIEDYCPPEHRNDLRDYRAECEAGPYAPLVVEIATRGSVGSDAVHLDGLLAALALRAVVGRTALPEFPGAYDIPIPLRVLWRDPSGLPLYATTLAQPVGDTIIDTTVIHRRAPRGRWARGRHGQRPRIETRAGRWREFRIPRRLIVTDRYRATCIGAADLIEQLAAELHAIGDGRGHGYGQVIGVTVRPAATEFSLVDDETGRLTREVPVGAVALLDGLNPVSEPHLLGWTPAYWQPATWVLGWPAGTETVASPS